MVSIEAKNLTKKFGDLIAVNNVSFSVQSGEMLALLGPSACGKTTTLRCISGLETPDMGEIRIGDRLMASHDVSVPPQKRNVGMVFQSYAVWPHMTVYENVAYGLKLKKLAKNEINEKVEKALNTVGLIEVKNRLATKLSGGQQQRVAVARSIATEPKALLFDEPLSNLDAKLREHMRFELRALQKRLGITSIYVTHSQSEALAIADRIAIMNYGKIIQIGTPQELYFEPINRFVSEFVGLANFFSGKLVETDEKFSVIQTDDNLNIHFLKRSNIQPQKRMTVFVRPRDIELFEKKPGSRINVWNSKVFSMTFSGDTLDCTLLLGSKQIRVQIDPLTIDLQKGKNIYIHINPTKCKLLPNSVT